MSSNATDRDLPRNAFLFDGVCNLCNASVDFIVRRDPNANVQFAALQSETAIRLMPGLDLDAGMNSSLLIQDGVVYQRSTAALRVARLMRWPWPMMYVFILVPRPIRDMVYNWIARNRYRWFGQRDTCRLPSAEEASRFLS
jgi:predicted DCC family thiol-disulfide oxidoreductase YuxK